MGSLLKTIEKRKISLFVNGLIAACVAFFPQQILSAQTSNDFRIETDVMLANEAEPIIQTVTIFQNGMAYDFSRREPKRVTVFRSVQNQVVFLDEERERQTKIDLQDLQAFMERARNELANSSLKEFLLDSELVLVDEQTRSVVVGKQLVRYEAKYQQLQNAAIAKLYTDFANASAYINSWQAPDRNPPSFARVKLNQVLGQRQAIPTEITRTMFFGDGREHTLRSRLHVSWQLSTEDQKTVQKFETMMNLFPSEDVGEFMAPAKTGSSAIGSGKNVQR